jgi:enoyl-CoA hydratase/carnithine racemase
MTDNMQRVGAVDIWCETNVVRATLDRPAVRNALDEGMVQGLEAAVATAKSTGAQLLVLRGSGGNFCSGADLKHVATLFADKEGKLFPYIGRLRAICRELAEGPFVSLAVVEGYALAGGYEILTACDLGVATTTAGIGDRHLEYALAPGLGASVHIGRHMGAKRARYLAYTGEILSGSQAADWGLVSHAWEPGEFEARTADLIERLSSRSPASLRSYKRMLLAGEREPHGEAMRLEAELFEQYQRGHSDAEQGVARFVGHRSPGDSND